MASISLLKHLPLLIISISRFCTEGIDATDDRQFRRCRWFSQCCTHEGTQIPLWLHVIDARHTSQVRDCSKAPLPALQKCKKPHKIAFPRKLILSSPGISSGSRYTRSEPLYCHNEDQWLHPQRVSSSFCRALEGDWWSVDRISPQPWGWKIAK